MSLASQRLHSRGLRSCVSLDVVVMNRFTFLLTVIVVAGGFLDPASASSRGPRAQLVAAPKPVYPAAAIERRIVGNGQFRLNMDFDTGRPVGIVILKSTGSPLLDRATVDALSRWRAVPGGIRRIDLPVFFRLTSRGPSVEF